MKTLRYFWWLSLAFFKKHWKTLLGAMSLGILAVAVGIKYYPDLKRLFRKEVRVGMVGRFSESELPVSVSGLVSYGLTKVGPDGKPEPDLGLSWETDESGTKYIFKIATSKTWSDNTPVAAGDLTISIKNVQVEIPDNETIIFKLIEPYSPFPVLVSKPIFKKDFVGLGPDRVISTKLNGEFIEELAMETGDKHRIRFRFYRTSGDLITAFKLGEIDEISDLPDLSSLPKWDEIEINESANFDRYSAVFFNTADRNFADKSFRQALTYSIPGKPSGPKRALSPISPQSFAYNPGVKPYDTNRKVAQELLAEALGGDEPPSIELTTTLPFLKKAEEIADAWSRIGVKTSVKVATVIPDNFQALLVGQERPADPDQYSLWHSTQASNITHYSSPKVDKLLEDGRQTMDQNKRLEIYRDFQRFLVEDSPAAFLEHLTTYNIRRK